MPGFSTWLAKWYHARRWQLHFGVNIHMWTDSRYVADGCRWHLSYPPVWGDRGLVHPGPLRENPSVAASTWTAWTCTHIGSPVIWTRQSYRIHLKTGLHCWNDRIDFAIGQYNFCRPREFLRLRDDLNLHFEQSAARMQQLQAFYFKVAAIGPAVPTEPPESNEVSLFGFVDELQPSFGDLYNSDARDFICNSDSRPVDLPADFILALVSHLAEHVDEASGVYPLCFAELSIWLVRDFRFLFPFQNAGSGVSKLCTLDSRFERPTLAYVMRYIRRALVWFVGFCLECPDVLFSKLSKVDLRVYKPTGGIYIGSLAERLHVARPCLEISPVPGPFVALPTWPGRFRC